VSDRSAYGLNKQDPPKTAVPTQKKALFKIFYDYVSRYLWLADEQIFLYLLQ
jgi:hypothetical protein